MSGLFFVFYGLRLSIISLSFWIMNDFVPQAHADTYSATGTQALQASTKDIADSGLPALGTAIQVIIPLIILGIITRIIMKKV